jgi:hypothetical protein
VKVCAFLAVAEAKNVLLNKQVGSPAAGKIRTASCARSISPQRQFSFKTQQEADRTKGLAWWLPILSAGSAAQAMNCMLLGTAANNNSTQTPKQISSNKCLGSSLITVQLQL